MSEHCGYCKHEPCRCNGFGGPKGLSRIEAESRCGYCHGRLYRAVPNGDGTFRAVEKECFCDGFGNPR